jgi:putative ABC transport system permease protein
MARVLYLTRVRLRRHRFASFAAALLITVVGGAVLSTLAAGRRTQSAYERLEHETRVTNGYVGLAGSADPDGVIAQIVKMPEVDGWSHVKLTGGRLVGTEDRFLGLAFPQDDRVRHDVERAHIVRGRAPNPDAPFEIVLGEARAKVLHATVGSDVALETFSQKQIEEQLAQGQSPKKAEGPAFKMRVVGLERGPRQIIQDVEAENDLTPVTPAFMRTVSPLPGTFSSALIFRIPDEKKIPAFLQRVKATPALRDLDVEFTNGKRIVDATDLVARSLYAFALISAICGTVALALFFARRASANIAEDDALAAMGVTRNERRAATVLDLVPAIVLGAVGALIAAIVVSIWMPFGLAGRVEPNPGLDVDWNVLAPGVAALFVGCVLLTTGVAWRTIGTRPHESRRAPVATRLVEGVRARPAPAAGVRMALERGRGTRAVPVGLALAGAVLVVSGAAGALTFGASLQRLIDEPKARGMSWDAEATVPDVRILLDDPDVASATSATLTTLTINDATVQAYGLKTVRGRPPDMFIEGRGPRTDDEIALGRETRRQLHVSTGSVVHATGQSGARYDLRVVGTAVFAGLSDDPILGEGAVLTYDGLDRIVRAPGAAPGSGLESEGNASYALTFAPAVNKTAAIDRLNAQLRPNGFSADVPRTPAELRRLRDVRALPAALAGFVGLLGVIAVGYAFVTAVQRRRSDLAMHKALGMTRGGVRAIVLTQATTTALVGIGLGVPFGLLVARLVWRLQVDKLGVSFVVVAPAVVLALVCLAAVAAANLCSLLPAARAVRTRPSTILRTE